MGRPAGAVHLEVSDSQRLVHRHPISARLPGLAALVGALLSAASASAQSPVSAVEQPMLAPALSDPPPLTASGPSVGLEAPPPSETQSAKKPRQFGAMLDLGVPDGAVVSFVYRPVRIARFHVGPGYNGVSPGLRLGGTLLPFGWGPSLSLDYGHYFEGDANPLVGWIAGTNEADSVLLERVGYDFVNLRAGMELGGDRFTFFARGGVSWIRTTLREFDTLLDPEDSQRNPNTTIRIGKDPVLNAFTPSLQLGFIVQI